MKITINDELLYETSVPVSHLVIEAPTGYQNININPLWTELNITVVPQPMEHSPYDYKDSPSYVAPKDMTEAIAKVLVSAQTTNELTATELESVGDKVIEIVKINEEEKAAAIEAEYEENVAAAKAEAGLTDLDELEPVDLEPVVIAPVFKAEDVFKGIKL